VTIIGSQQDGFVRAERISIEMGGKSAEYAP
jgi:hypothetical protein